MRRHGKVGMWCVVVGLLLAAGSVLRAAEQAAPETWVGQTLDSCCFGGDIRIRQVHFDDIPIIADPPGVTRGGENQFFRFRTRLWGQYDPSETVTIKTRLVNEFRHFVDPDMSLAPDTASSVFPDELVVDKLYVEMRDLMDGKLNLKIGRQDMIYGTGKLILDGTPKDGSRTIYLDAIKATLKPNEKCSVDVFGIYNQSENNLSINNFDGSPDKRDVIGYDRGFNDCTESGGGLYLKSAKIEQMPFEAYYIYKNESSWLNYTNGNEIGQDVHTVGFRIMPKLEDSGVDANVEFAYQFGDDDAGDDVEGMMLDAIVNWHLPVAEELKLCIGLGYYYLSGDDPNTSKNEGWNPLWARWPQYSELYIYAWDAERAGRWANISMPHVDLTLVPWEGAKAKFLVGQMSAPEDDGPGIGDERGLLITARLDFPLWSGLLGEKDRLFAHVTYEYLDPGDYYNVTQSAHFARWEISYAF